MHLYDLCLISSFVSIYITSQNIFCKFNFINVYASIYSHRSPEPAEDRDIPNSINPIERIIIHIHLHTTTLLLFPLNAKGLRIPPGGIGGNA